MMGEGCNGRKLRSNCDGKDVLILSSDNYARSK